jgi:hypothetical protein
MVKTKKQINNLAVVKYKNKDHGLFLYNGYIAGYAEAQKEMMRYKKGFDLLYDFIDDLSEEWAAENPELVKQLDKLGL